VPELLQPCISCNHDCARAQPLRQRGVGHVHAGHRRGERERETKETEETEETKTKEEEDAVEGTTEFWMGCVMVVR
jgi:hypothetical protein